MLGSVDDILWKRWMDRIADFLRNELGKVVYGTITAEVNYTWYAGKPYLPELPEWIVVVDDFKKKRNINVLDYLERRLAEVFPTDLLGHAVAFRIDVTDKEDLWISLKHWTKPDGYPWHPRHNTLGRCSC